MTEKASKGAEFNFPRALHIDQKHILIIDDQIALRLARDRFNSLLFKLVVAAPKSIRIIKGVDRIGISRTPVHPDDSSIGIVNTSLDRRVNTFFLDTYSLKISGMNDSGADVDFNSYSQASIHMENADIDMKEYLERLRRSR